MTKKEMTERIIEAKTREKLTWGNLAAKTGKSPVWLASACMGMNSAPEETAGKVCEALGLPPEVSEALQQCPSKSWEKAVPTDPVIYRLYEIVGVYGDTIKSIIHEEFGDGIMSAIDFSMHIEKVADPKGDRVKITMNGKFLPYRNW